MLVQGTVNDAMKKRSTIRFVMEGMEGILVSLAVILTWPVSKRWLENRGSTSAERQKTWPGDALVENRKTVYTRGISIAASAETVWTWVVQFGYGRAGFYSYELLERLVGIPVTNMESIDPALQSLERGDEILLHPKVPGIPVAFAEQNTYVCFGELDGRMNPVQDTIRSWSFYVEPTGRMSCRLILRGCIEALREPTIGKRIGLAFEGPIDFIMEQRMMRTIKRLSETLSRVG